MISGIRVELEAALDAFIAQLGTTTSKQKNGIYLYGPPGTQKTVLAMHCLKKAGYDVIAYDASDVRSAAVMLNLSKHLPSSFSIVSSFQPSLSSSTSSSFSPGKAHRVALLMDEMDGMTNGDKGGLKTLIQLLKPTKRKGCRRLPIPIVCIGNNRMEKKITELMRVCHVLEIPLLTDKEIKDRLLLETEKYQKRVSDQELDTYVRYIHGDLRKLSILSQWLQNDNTELLQWLCSSMPMSEDSKSSTCHLFQHPTDFSQHEYVVHDADRTSVGLLWHENLPDMLDQMRLTSPHQWLQCYYQQLCRISYSDGLDRIAFQHQFWTFKEMSFFVHTMQNHHEFHTWFPSAPERFDQLTSSDIRFTKVLTKYSTEYNNHLFLYMLCQKLGMDMNDLIVLFLAHRKESEQEAGAKEGGGKEPTMMNAWMEKYDLTKLNVQRMEKIVDVFLNESAKGLGTNVKVDAECFEDEECFASDRMEEVDLMDLE